MIHQTPCQLQKGLPAKKRLGQNFLIDSNIIQKQLLAADIQEGDLVLEIGPGPGALTQALLQKGAIVFAIEKDQQLAQSLEKNIISPNLHLIIDDFFNVDLSFLKKEKKIKVVANLPYQLTSPILGRLLDHVELFSSLTVMVQYEVAKRMCAKVNSSDYSSITLFLAQYGKAKFNFSVSRNCFFPKPKVESAVVTLEITETCVDKNLQKLIRAAFNQRRKMLRRSLQTIYPKETLENLPFLTKRAENLSLQDFKELYERINSSKNSSQQDFQNKD